MLPDPGFLYLSKKHQAALTLLEYGLLNHVGFCVISGEAGAGKTTILRALLERIGDDVTVGLITNTHQSFGGLLDWVLSAFDLHKPNLTHVEMHQVFMDYLIDEYANNRTVLLIVDEAQNMKPDALEELRMLSNVNSDKDQLVQVVLAGQPMLKETLRKPELMQFAQRIAVDYHLDSLSLKETCGYIQHRLKTAGAQKDVFTPAACERIHCYSGGTPRLINLLCETVLVYGFADPQEMIDVDLVDEMVLERMKDSVVPIVNRDAAKNDNKKISDELEKDFPWIRPAGGAEDLKPKGKKVTVDTASDDKQKITEAPDKPVAPTIDTREFDKVKGEKEKVEKPDDSIVATENKPSSIDRGKAKAPAPENKKTETKKAARKSVQASSQKPGNKLAGSASTDGETRRQFIKYGSIAVAFAIVLVVLAVLLNGEDETVEVVDNEALLLQEQRKQEAEKMKQLQKEAETLKKERDAAIAKAEDEKRAKQQAEKLAAEKAILAAKAAEEKRKLDEKKRVAEARKRERLAKQREAKALAAARAEADRAKREAARLEEERRAMKARMAEQQRLKELEASRRLELEQREKQRLELEAEKERIRQQAAAEESAKKAKSKSAECSGPTARFKAGCR